MTLGKVNPPVSVVILNYNGSDMTLRCVDSILRKTRYPYFEVIVVDNGSEGRDFERLVAGLRGVKRVRMVRSRVNLGFAGGCNLGARKSRGELLVFLNNDTWVEEGWLCELVRTFTDDPRVGAAQSLLLRPDGTVDSSGDFIDLFGVSMRRDGDWGARYEGQYRSVEEIFSSRGAAMAVRRDVFEALGGFDEDFFLTYEDIDLSWRVRRLGYKVVLVPTSVVYHVGEASECPSALKVFHYEKNRLLTIFKNSPPNILIKYNPFLPLLANMAFSVLQRRGDHLAARVRALAWVMRRLRKIWRRRKALAVSLAFDSRLMLRTGYRAFLRFCLTWALRGKREALWEYYRVGGCPG